MKQLHMSVSNKESEAIICPSLSPCQFSSFRNFLCLAHALNAKNQPSSKYIIHFLSHCRLLEEVEAQNEQLAAIEAESQQIQVALEAQEAVVADLRRRREEREARERREAEENARNQAASGSGGKKPPPGPPAPPSSSSTPSSQA